ncbi:hypothetical protein TNCT_386461 [Trichonephila clavata]|uniref:Uncharacterized protein n=1 Tax=Trichonephila clavata TaxID=2740835 RepID=A0A8X6F8K1_TRICU|nr:hypothetical protein TNCT_386461 [Trichonephila clavata]
MKPQSYYKRFVLDLQVSTGIEVAVLLLRESFAWLFCAQENQCPTHCSFLSDPFKLVPFSCSVESRTVGSSIVYQWFNYRLNTESGCALI